MVHDFVFWAPSVEHSLGNRNPLLIAVNGLQRVAAKETDMLESKHLRK